MSPLYLAKSARLLAYGAASVALPVHLVASRLPAIWIGAVLALALIAGALQMTLTARLSRRFGAKALGIAAAVTMAVGGLMAATGSFVLIVLAAALGALNATAHEIGPFLPLEQATLGAGEHGVHRMALYNAVGTGSLALGTLAGGALPFRTALLLYALCAVAVAAVYTRASFTERTIKKPISLRRRFSATERLAALFAVDAFAGGLIVQGFLAYWLLARFHTDPQTIGMVLAACNVLSALSLFAAAQLGKRFGLLNTMVFTHLPSNVLLALVPLASSFPVAAGLLLARYALSQMDVPTRQAFVVRIVPKEERIYATGMTSAVRPFAAAASPLISSLTMQIAAFGLPFFAAGGIKACYDLAVFFAFRRIKPGLSI